MENYSNLKEKNKKNKIINYGGTKMTDKERFEKLEKIADKYGVNIEEEYPIPPEECEGEFEEVEE